MTQETNSGSSGFVGKNKIWVLDWLWALWEIIWWKEWAEQASWSIEERFLRQIQEISGTGIGKWLGKRAKRLNEERLTKEVYGILSVKLKVEWAHGKEEVEKIGYIHVTGIWQNWGKNYFKTKHLFYT